MIGARHSPVFVRLARGVRSARSVGIAALASGAIVLTGCSSAIEVTAPPAADSPACDAAAAHWPSEVAGQEPTATDPTHSAVRAWGDPAIVVRCGVSALGPTEDPCVVVDDIDWVAEELDDGTRLTTFGRDPALEVLVPDAYDPAALLLPAFTDAAGALPRNERACT